MDHSESLFLFEAKIKHLQSFVESNKFICEMKFADIFILDKIEACANKKTNMKRSQATIRNKNKTNKKKSMKSVEHSIVFADNINTIIHKMQKFPLELVLRSKTCINYSLGSTIIPWSNSIINYLIQAKNGIALTPAYDIRMLNVINECTSQSMASLKLRITLVHLNSKSNQWSGRLSIENLQNLRNNLSPNNSTLSVTTEKLPAYSIDTGRIKTFCANRQKKRITNSKMNEPDKNIFLNNTYAVKDESKLEQEPLINSTAVSIVQSETNLKNSKQVIITRSRSLTSIIDNQHMNTLNYIFDEGPFANQTYFVGYCTTGIEKPDTKSSKSSVKDGVSSISNEESNRFRFNLCESSCPSKNENNSCKYSDCSLNLSRDAGQLVTLTKCKKVTCRDKKLLEPPPPLDDRVLLDLTGLNKTYCKVSETEEMKGELTAKMNIDGKPCFCECECTFGFMKKTTYCKICKGYERPGEELARKLGTNLPHPCPVYHKLVDKKPSDSKRKIDDEKTSLKSKGSKRSVGGDRKSNDSEKESKKSKKKSKDDRFKFNYGYQAPKIGHSQCALPCTGNLEVVPKTMGWMWTADNIPGLKFRPSWKPGATNKRVVRLLKIARNPGEVLAKKKRRDTGKKKKPLKRPLLTVHKKDGEYTVMMENMKTYPKPRTINQAPYDESPVYTYTIGRTNEENCIRQKKKDRAKRRLERAQRMYLQSAFKDMCRDICLKTYRQALGILPHAEDPECECFPANPDDRRINLEHSCSCSDTESSLGSDTDSDEWIVEFTPPNAYFDPKLKVKKTIKVDNSSQYTYLDYRVKLLDRYGNLVPRFFKGPNGKTETSDLGGFWSPDHKWLEINVDGYIAPDGKWAPHNFIGPNGEQIEDETGKFQAMNGNWLVVGIDGYVDCQGKWRYYPKPRGTYNKNNLNKTMGKIKASEKKDNKRVTEIEPTWSCFGDVSPRQLSKVGIIGHGHDKRMLHLKLKEMISRGESVQIPQPSVVPRLQVSKKGRNKREQVSGLDVYDSRSYFEERNKCKHPVPSEKGITAINSRGNKTYFRLLNHKNMRPRKRLEDLKSQGISLSSFHVPCFSSFINSEVMKQQQRDRLQHMADDFVNSTSIQVKRGWKPGAVSKRLLRKLIKAKQQTSKVLEKTGGAKKLKKIKEDKPLLVVSKKNGEFRVEMQVKTESTEGTSEYHSPLIYNIASINNEDKIKKIARLEKKLIDKAIKKVWSANYDADLCKQICEPAYNQAIQSLPYAPESYECYCDRQKFDQKLYESCNCSDEDVSSDCNSLDLDWELQFSPPNMHNS